MKVCSLSFETKAHLSAARQTVSEYERSVYTVTVSIKLLRKPATESEQEVFKKLFFLVFGDICPCPTLMNVALYRGN